MIRTFKIVLFILLLSAPFNVANSDILKFEDGSYECETKKGKAYGVGKFTFSDDSTYEGKFKKNRFHGKGKYTTKSGEVFEGKWRRGRFNQKVNNKTRKIIILTVESGMFEMYEVRGKSSVSNKWFHAEKIGSEILLSEKGKWDKAKAIQEKHVLGAGPFLLHNTVYLANIHKNIFKKQ